MNLAVTFAQMGIKPVTSAMLKCSISGVLNHPLDMSFQWACINHVFTLYIYNIIYGIYVVDMDPSPRGLIMDPKSDKLPFGLIAQLVEHCTNVKEINGFIIQAQIFQAFVDILLDMI